MIEVHSSKNTYNRTPKNLYRPVTWNSKLTPQNDKLYITSIYRAAHLHVSRYTSFSSKYFQILVDVLSGCKLLVFCGSGKIFLYKNIKFGKFLPKYGSHTSFYK